MAEEYGYYDLEITLIEVPCPECGAPLEGPYEGRVACRACGCILFFEGDTVRVIQEAVH